MNKQRNKEAIESVLMLMMPWLHNRKIPVTGFCDINYISSFLILKKHTAAFLKVNKR